MRRRVEAEKSLRDAEQPALAAAVAHKRDLEATRNELSARLEELRASTKVTKESLLAARDNAQGLAGKVAETKAGIEGAKAMIVSSPEKIRAEVENVEALVTQKQGALDGLDRQRRKLAQQLEVVAKADKDVIKAMKLMAEAEVRFAAAAEAAAAAAGPLSLFSPVHFLRTHTHTPPCAH